MDADAATATFKLLPMPGHLERAVGQAEEWLHEALTDLLGGAGVPVYYGSP